MSGADARLLGRWGEELVAKDLRRRGHSVLASGFRCRFGEIDIISSFGKYIIFTEVKLRKDASFAPARAFVDRRKQERLRITAEVYLAKHPSKLQPRFDVAEVYAPDGLAGEARLVYIENAF